VKEESKLEAKARLSTQTNTRPLTIPNPPQSTPPPHPPRMNGNVNWNRIHRLLTLPTYPNASSCV
jgi:hypothetical protein